jgi:putative ABC transport system permease protein
VNDHVSVGLPAGTRSGNAIEVDIVGTYEDSTTPGGLIVHYYYLVAAMPRMPMGNTLSNLYVRASAARDAPETAKRIDELFRNSAAPTQSAPWNSLLQQLSQSMRSMRLVMMSIVLASSFTMLVVVTSALAYSVHERIGEMAVLSGLGFQTPTLIALVVAEALLLLGIGCVAGLVLGQAGLAWSAAQPSQDSLLLPAHTVLVALGVVLASTAISAALPGWQIARMKVAERLHQL